jgi:hypothetical protein
MMPQRRGQFSDFAQGGAAGEGISDTIMLRHNSSMRREVAR